MEATREARICPCCGQPAERVKEFYVNGLWMIGMIMVVGTAMLAGAYWRVPPLFG